MNREHVLGWVRHWAIALAVSAMAGVVTAGDTASVTLEGRALSSDRQYWTYSSITLVHADDKPFKSLMISLTHELADTDEIVLPADTGKIWDKEDLCTKSSKIIQISGATDAEIAAYLRGVKFYTVGNKKGQGVKVVATPEDISARTFYFEGTRHYYQFVDTSSYFTPWHVAYDKAKNLRFLGRQGYLATVMSYEEDLFIYKVSNKVGWLGGTLFKHGDAQSINGNDLYYTDFKKSPYWTEKSGGQANDVFNSSQYGDSHYPEAVNAGGWYWACGPERGMVFFEPLLVRKTTAKNYGTWTSPEWKSAFQAEKSKGRYFNWEIGHTNGETAIEPNAQQEPCLTTLDTSGFIGYATQGTSAKSYSWNNIRDAEPSASAAYKPTGFFVEYGNQLVGDTTEENPPKDWGVAEEPVPSIYYVKLEGVADSYYLASDVASNLWTVAELALSPPDAVHTNFFGWSKTQGAAVPDLIDGQPIQGYAPALETVNLYPVWTDQPVVTGRFVTRKEAEIFRLKAIGFDLKTAGTLVMTDGGGTETNLVCYAFAAPRGAYGLDARQKGSNYGAWVELVTVETDGVTTGPDFTGVRIWDTRGDTRSKADWLDASQLVGRFSQIRGSAVRRNFLFGAMPVFESVDCTQWALDEFARASGCPADSSWSRWLHDRPTVCADGAAADGAISSRMKRYWSDLAAARSPEFMLLELTMTAGFVATKASASFDTYRRDLSCTDVSPVWGDRFAVVAVEDADCRVSVSNLPWRIYRYCKDGDGTEHYDIIRQRHEGSVYQLADGSAGEDLGEYFELHDGYALLYLKRFGQLAFIDPTDCEIDPGEQYKQNESTWGWTNMTAYGEMVYDRMELELHNSTDPDDRIIFPAGLGWGPSVQPNQHQFYTNDTGSLNVSVTDIATNVLNRVRLELPSNGEDIYWTVKLYRADGYKPYELDIGISNAWYVVAYRPSIPGAGNTEYFTYKNVRTITPPLASENLGFGVDGKVFYCWQRGNVNFLDDGQPFFDISKAFQTNYLNALWVDTPVISGDCPTNLNAAVGVRLVSVGETNAVSGDVLCAMATPGRYVATAAPGLYGLVYTDSEALPHTELVELAEGRAKGPSFFDDIISTGVDNANAESGFKLLAGGLRAYGDSVYAVCELFFAETSGHDYDHFQEPRFELVSQKVTDAERTALAVTSNCFAVRARMSMKFLSTPDPTYVFDWSPAARSDPATIGQQGYLLGTNLPIRLIVPFDTLAYAGCTNTWAVRRLADNGVVDALTTEPNAAGEGFVLADGHLELTVRTFGAFGIRPPDLETRLDLGAADYTNEYGVSHFPSAQGSGDLLYSSVRVGLTVDGPDAGELGFLGEAATIHGVEVLTNSTATSLVLRFSAPKTAADIAALITDGLWVESEYSFSGADVKVECFTNDSAEGEAQYTSESAHIPTRAAIIRLLPGARGQVAAGADPSFVAPSNTVQYLIPARIIEALGFWELDPPSDDNRYFYGWEFDGKVRFGEAQEVCNRFRIGETNILTAVWTNMPVVAGEVARDSNAVSVAVWTFTNRTEAVIFEGGTDRNRYAQPMPPDEFCNVAVEYRDTAGGEVKNGVAALVTNDVEVGASFDFTGRVATASMILPPPEGDSDYTLVGGLDGLQGAFSRVTARTGHLKSGAAYSALAAAVGTRVGTYFDLGLDVDGAATASAPQPLTVYLPFDSSAVLDPERMFKVYRYADGKATEVPSSEYVLLEDCVALTTTRVAPIALGVSLPVVFEGCGTNTLRWLRTDTRSSYFAAVRLKLVSGDAGSIEDACFLFEDRLTNLVDGVVRTNACLWGGRLDRQNKGNHIASQLVNVNGVVFRKVPLEFFREAACDTNAEGLVTYGITDASLAAGKILPTFGQATTQVMTNSWAHQTEIEVMIRPGEKLPDMKETLDGIMGFIGYSTAGAYMTYLPISAGDQGIVTNYQVVVSNITEAVRRSAYPSRMLELVTAGPVSMTPENLRRIRDSLAFNVILDAHSSPYCRIADFVVDNAEISGRVEVGADGVEGALGRNTSVTLLGARTLGGSFAELQTIRVDGASGDFRFQRPADCAFFKLRINVEEL